MHFNSLGIRSLREYSVEPSEDTVRILLLGSSVMLSAEVSDTHSLSFYLEKQLEEAGKTVEVSPGFPRDAIIRTARVNDQEVSVATRPLGDVQLAKVVVPNATSMTKITYELSQLGSDVSVRWKPALPGASNEQIRVLRSEASAAGLTLLLEGLNGHEHTLQLHSDREILGVEGAVQRNDQLSVSFVGEGDIEGWVRKTVRVKMK